MATVSSTWRFTRALSPQGFSSTNRASTDAINALNKWESGQEPRHYEVKVDEDDCLVAILTTDTGDAQSGTALDGACNKCGVSESQSSGIAEKRESHACLFYATGLVPHFEVI